MHGRRCLRKLVPYLFVAVHALQFLLFQVGRRKGHVVVDEVGSQMRWLVIL